jgi:hypothetical protein
VPLNLAVQIPAAYGTAGLWVLAHLGDADPSLRPWRSPRHGPKDDGEIAGSRPGSADALVLIHQKTLHYGPGERTHSVLRRKSD